MITLGLDIGSIFTKGLLLEGDRIRGFLLRETTGNIGSELEEMIEQLLSQSGLVRENIAAIVATGQGEDLYKGADYGEDDFVCVAAATRHLLPEVGLTIDIGGQSITTILSGPQGEVLNYMRNDKCASGSGRFIEVLGAALGVPMEEIDAVAGRSQKKIAVSTQCAVFAESEVISYVNRGESIPDLVAGVCDSVARMVISQVLRIGPVDHYTVTGGVARFQSIVEKLEERLNGRYHPFPIDPQLAAVYGAALLGREE
ncbi:MAG: acyl-CoA dehydratase activase [Dethiobacteria bacterium]|jgi:predicted CoA-substrate-specific enzyme activase|nr:2-hydroxyglutaryl-CoA dehydratase [Bacillota bacterium]HPZ65278.1 acyl-CoA dehydratase activase [Bacillota bacterium]